MNVIQELWTRRSLIWDFAVSDLKIRYRNSVLGFFWTFLEPLLMLAVLYIVFTEIFKNKIEYYPLYLLLGIITWSIFSKGTSIALNSIVNRSGILSQVYFPREIISISATLTTAMMFSFEFIAFGIFMVIFQFIPPITILFFPVILLMLFILVCGVSLALSTLNAYYRDIQFIWNVILQAGFFIVPVFYTLDTFPDNVRKIVMLNPLAQIVEITHNVVLYGKMPSFENISYTFGIILGIFAIGYLIFKRLDVRLVEEL